MLTVGTKAPFQANHIFTSVFFLVARYHFINKMGFIRHEIL